MSLPANYSASPLERLQLDLAARLEADAYFVDLPVTVIRPRAEESFATLQTKIDKALSGLIRKNGKGGAAVSVFMALAEPTDPNVPGPRLDYTITVRIEENPVLNMGANGTRKSCEEIALRTAQLLHLFNPGKGNVVTCAALRPVEVDGRVVYELDLTQKGGVAGLPKVATPVLAATSTVVGAEVTLSCATVGAEILFTRDGSYPVPGVASTETYSAPFTIAAAGTLRVAATCSGYAQSDVREATFA